MKLTEWMKATKRSAIGLAKELNISPQSLRQYMKGYEPSLSTALLIEDFTRGAVTCRELKPTKSRTKKNKQCHPPKSHIEKYHSSEKGISSHFF